MLYFVVYMNIIIVNINRNTAGSHLPEHKEWFGSLKCSDKLICIESRVFSINTQQHIY